MKTSQRQFPFDFSDKVIVRTPSMPFIPALDRKEVQQLCAKPFVQEALYLASPSFYDQVQKYQEGAPLSAKDETKLHTKLYKYLVRMSTRSTPFGLFAGCSVARWGHHTNFVLDNHLKRKTRLDMAYYGSLAADLCRVPEIRSKLRFYTNSSIYTVGNEYRFVSYQYTHGNRTHTITAIAIHDYLRKIYEAAHHGMHYQHLLQVIDDETIGEAEKKEFLDEADSLPVFGKQLSACHYRGRTRHTNAGSTGSNPG